MLFIVLFYLRQLSDHQKPCCAQMQPGAIAVVANPATVVNKPSEPPVKKPSSTVVKGTVTAQGQLLPAEMVVYLEPSDQTQKPNPPEKHAIVSQKAAQFSPAFSVVSVGQAVDFQNDEDRQIEHNVFSNAVNARFDLGLFPQGQSRTVTFEKPGPVILYCSVHRFMDGVIFVCPGPYFSKVDAEGNFRIEGAPAGEYSVKTWQRRARFPELSKPVKITDSQDLTINLEMHRK